MADILTIIVTFNGMKWIDKCLRSLMSSVVATDVVIVDNHSEDGTAQWVQEHFPNVPLFRNDDNIGFAAANNMGFRYAITHGYKFIYLLNQDAWIFPETFATLTRVFATSEKYGILSPMQMVPNLSKQDAQFHKHCGKAVGGSEEEVVDVPFVMAAHWMITQECLQKVGGFSPAFPHYGEDNDFINRSAYHGFHTAVVKTAMAVHDRSGRPRPKEYRMNLKNINARVAVANPGKNAVASLLTQTCFLTAMGVIHFSTIPFKGIKEMWSSFKELKNTRKLSQKGEAFLD